jgi:DNA-directed RNA polymerase subunit L
MVTEKTKYDNENAVRPLWERFKKIQEQDAPKRKKKAHRLALSVEHIVEEEKKDNPNFSWERLPWLIQFLPALVEIAGDANKLNAVNPGISGISGLLGTPKNEINERLSEDFRPRNLFLKKSPESRDELDKMFAGKYGEKIKFPVVFKPAVGERASFFECLQESEVDNFLKEKAGTENVLFEEFADTKSEFGLSWTRDPDTGEFEIDSLVEKKFPTVTGDGQRKIGELVEAKLAELNLEEEKAEKIRKWNRHHAEQILPAGEEIVISRAASISFGTKFQKIKIDKKDPSLINLLKKMIVKKDGVYAGRFDLRADDLENLKNGNVKIIEMNGIGGMPLEVYESHLKIEEKYEILRKHFQKLLKIGEKNIAKMNGKEITFFRSAHEVLRHFFGPNKKQELPPGVVKQVQQIFKVSTKGRLSVYKPFLWTRNFWLKISHVLKS